MAVEIRPITAEELDRYIELCQTAFGSKPEEGEAERITEVIGLDRVHAAFDDGRMVGTDAAYGMRLTVPGTPSAADSDEPVGDPPGGVAAAGLTRVSVAATHRRRGILTALIEAHFADADERGEPLSILWASELPIYGRFGYGPAVDQLQVRYDARAVGIRRPDRPDDLAYAEGDEARELLPELRERSRLTRPGQYHRPDVWWEHRNFADHEFWRDGASPLRTVIARRDGRPVGYATYRQAPRWTDQDVADGEVRVVESVGLDLTARHTLWWYLSNIDLHPNVRFWTLPVDSELPWLATDQRTMLRELSDGIQVRVLDVVAALEQRRWVEPGHLTFAVTDAHHGPSAGTYRLDVGDDGTASVERVEAEAEATLHPSALGALYLGSRPAEALAVAGLLDATPEVRSRLSRLFAWPVAAWCDEGF